MTITAEKKAQNKLFADERQRWRINRNIEWRKTKAVLNELDEIRKEEGGKQLKHIINGKSWKYKELPLYKAIERKNLEVIKALVDNGADLITTNSDCLYRAINKKDLDIVNVFLFNGAKTNKTIDDKGNTLLHRAVELCPPTEDTRRNTLTSQSQFTSSSTRHIKEIRIVEALIAFGAKATMPNKEGKTPLAISQNETVTSILNSAAQTAFTATVKKPLEQKQPTTTKNEKDNYDYNNSSDESDYPNLQGIGISRPGGF